MKVEVKVLLRNQVMLPATAMCRVEIRDVSLLDAPSITVCSHLLSVADKTGITVVTDLLEVPSNYPAGRHLNVWAHLSISGSERIQSGDFITVQAFPVKTDSPYTEIVVELQLIQ